MKRLPVTSGFSQDLSALMGYVELTDESLAMIHSLIENGVIMEFAIGFTGKPQEDGTYTDVELLEISMVPRNEQK